MKSELNWIIGKTIQSIQLSRDEDYNNNITSVSLLIDGKTIVFNIDTDTDSIRIDNAIQENVNHNEELKFNNLFVNKKVVSFWFPINHLGFNDVFILGLEKFVPTHFFTSVSSCIKICSVNQLD
ncbi:DUF6334 family protein [Chryseobacterium sp. JM1]|uniref:DUF6334 family protein n=1 Tax=Chryseobacterium sp. JM1 TaxID=1233950 RepID=UPI0004E72E32|nr:DUF6334 family protein [Chryseobacterium sp. JM1]KFF16482.1 hypothetical protein IW22_22860 [Chryseobacterium sp. JM1]